MSKNLGNDVLHEDTGQKMPKLKNWWASGGHFGRHLELRSLPTDTPVVLTGFGNTPPKNSKTLKISRGSFHSRLGPISSRPFLFVPYVCLALLKECTGGQKSKAVFSANMPQLHLIHYITLELFRVA